MSVYRRDLMNLNISLFLVKDDELLEKYNEIWEKLEIASKKKLSVNLDLIENIKKLK